MQDQQTSVRNYLKSATWLRISEIARLTGIPRESLSKFLNSTYQTKNGIELYGLNEKYMGKLIPWLIKFTDFR